MNLTVKFESGEPGVNYRKFEIDACFMEPAADTIAPLLIHLADLLTSQHPADIMEIVPHFVP